MSQTRHIFSTKDAKPVSKTERNNKADAQTSRHFIQKKKKKAQTTGWGGEWGYPSNGTGPASKSKAPSWTSPFPPVYGLGSRDSPRRAMSCGVMVSSPGCGWICFQGQSSPTFAAGSWTSCKLSSPIFLLCEELGFFDTRFLFIHIRV